MPLTKRKLVLKFLLLIILVTIPIAMVFIAKSGYVLNEHPAISHALIILALCLGVALAVIDPVPFKHIKKTK